MASSIAGLARDYRSLSPWRRDFLPGETLQVRRHGELNLAWRNVSGPLPWRAKSRLAGDEGMFAMASYDSAWRNDVRTDYGITNFSTPNPIFHHVKPQIRLK